MRKVRVMYEKTGRAAYISHLDIMRTFQRAITRAGIAIKHTEGFNPHPYISIALPLSLGYIGRCEFLDMEITDGMPLSEITERLNRALPEGIVAKKTYENFSHVRNIAYSEYKITLEYDGGVGEALKKAITNLFASKEIVVVKKSKRGENETNIAEMIKSAELKFSANAVEIRAVLCAGNVSLNPEYLIKAIEKYIPESAPDYVEYERINVYEQSLCEFR